jgi:two-component system, NarL family, nitrate/nitrite response regulator NarL
MTDVFVIGPIRLHRESLSAALDSTANVRVVGDASTLEEALPQLRALEGSAVALLDAPLPTDADLPLAVAAEPEMKVVAVGVPDHEAVAWIEAGVSGFVPPDATLEDAVVALENVGKGQVAASPQVTAHLASRVRRLAAESPDLIPEEQLTSREAEILELLGEGLTNKQIAHRLSIQEQTVKNHVHHILVKLRVNRRADAARTRRWRP